MKLTKALEILLMRRNVLADHTEDDLTEALCIGIEAIEELIKLRNASAGYCPPKLLHETKGGD